MRAACCTDLQPTTPRSMNDRRPRRRDQTNLEGDLEAFRTKLARWKDDERISAPPRELDGFYSEDWQKMCRQLDEFANWGLGILWRLQPRAKPRSSSRRSQPRAPTQEDTIQTPREKSAKDLMELALKEVRDVASDAAQEMMSKGRADCLQKLPQKFEEMQTLVDKLKSMPLEEEQAAEIMCHAIPSIVGGPKSEERCSQEADAPIEVADPPLLQKHNSNSVGDQESRALAD